MFKIFFNQLVKKISLIKFANWLDKWHITRIFQSLSSFLLIITLIGFYFNYKQIKNEQEDRNFTRTLGAWQLITTKAVGNSGKKDALEYLNRKGINLNGINLSVPENEVGTYLANINLENCMLIKANLKKANLDRANLKKANLASSNLEKTYLSNANLEQSILAGANLYKAFLVGANLEYVRALGVNLKKADLLGASLKYSNFAKANFKDADLRYVDLSYTNLSSAILKNAHLYRANLLHVTNFTCKQLKSARAWETTYRDSKLACGKDIPKLSKTPVPDWLKGSM